MCPSLFCVAIIECQIYEEKHLFLAVLDAGKSKIEEPTSEEGLFARGGVGRQAQTQTTVFSETYV